MKLAYVEMCGFRGYRKPVRIDFADGVTILDGRNGVGKSTVFDAIEFTLTGTIAKYADAKADGETVADYLWWSGAGSAPDEKFVEVGFRDDNGVVVPVRRSQLAGVKTAEIEALIAKLCDTSLMPKAPLPQLCAASIIRDERIAALSVDLKEADRYALIRDALGATDAEQWVERGARLLAIAKRHLQTAESDAQSAALIMSAASRRIDELRASLVEEGAVAAAAERLRLMTGSTATPDMLPEPGRALAADLARRIELLEGIEEHWSDYENRDTILITLREDLENAEREYADSEKLLTQLRTATQRDSTSAALKSQASELASLLVLGRRIGRINDGCPVCSHAQTESTFLAGLERVESMVAQLDERALAWERQELELKSAEEAVRAAKRKMEAAAQALTDAKSRAATLEAQLASARVAASADIAQVRFEIDSARSKLTAAREDLRILDTLKLNASLERAVHQEGEAKDAYARAEERLGAARLAATRAQTLHDAARRATGETLNRRLERVLPLMAELYRRLRPHPFWSDIDYKVRGDVRRFMKLEVGDELNPQFMFSSGQRRATGLAFLLSVNLALAWSRWRSLLLDDPVQHVDDFRSIHLAEVLAQVRISGRQIICAVEDEALADLLCRRLPIGSGEEGKRITLGPDAEGALTKVREQSIAPLLQGALVTDRQRLAG